MLLGRLLSPWLGGNQLPERFIWLAGILLLIVMVKITISIWLWSYGETSLITLAATLSLLGTALMVLILLIISTRDSLLAPLKHISLWATDMQAGHLNTRLNPADFADYPQLARSINDLSDTLQALTLDMQAQVEKQTRNIQQKTRSLEILYDVSASINTSRDLDDLLTRFLNTLKEVVAAKAATVRLIHPDGATRLVASSGVDEATLAEEQRQKLYPTPDLEDRRIGPVASITRIATSHAVSIPLQYRGKNLGYYNLYVDENQYPQLTDQWDLLTSIGRHLGMAIEKASVDQEANKLSIIEERNRIAHELHDSLAQTLASLRFQVRVLDETLHLGDESALWEELERIENSIDEAYTELRGLIDHFRAPIDHRGLLPAVRKLVERFRQDSDIQIFLQEEWGNTSLPEEIEIQILRIIQEALINVRKHSEAHTVRLLMRRSGQGGYLVLIEDDGIGLPDDPPSGGPGEHVGLNIMNERARRIGGHIVFESEPGEGTRLLLRFGPPSPIQSHERGTELPSP